MSTVKKLTVKQWEPLDELVKEMQGVALDVAKKMAEATYVERQQEVADRYGMSQSAVAKWVKIGEQVDSRFIRIANKLPSSQETLYELSTLSDEGFKNFKAKVTPKTTRLEVQDYKRGLKGKAGVKKAALKKAAPPVSESEPMSDEENHEWVDQLRGVITGCKEPMPTAGELPPPNALIHKQLLKKLEQFGKRETKVFATLFRDVLAELIPELRRSLAEAMPNDIKAERESLNQERYELMAAKREFEDAQKNRIAGISKGTIRFINQNIHPDYAPEGKEAAYTKAFQEFNGAIS